MIQVTGSHTLTHLLHELVIILPAINFPCSIKCHGCRLVWLKAVVDRGILNAHWPPFIYTSPALSPHTHTHTSLNWHWRCSSLSHWLSVCWCSHLKTVSNVGRLLHDLEHTWINDCRSIPVSVAQLNTVTLFCRREKKEEWAVCMSFNWAPLCSSIFSLLPCLCLAWQ